MFLYKIKLSISPNTHIFAPNSKDQKTYTKMRSIENTGGLKNEHPAVYIPSFFSRVAKKKKKKVKVF